SPASADITHRIRWLWHHPVLQVTDALHLHAHHVAHFEPTWRLHAGGHAATRTSGDHIARLQRPGGGGVFDHFFPVMNHVAGVVVLAHLTVDGGAKLQVVRGGDLVGGDNPGTERAVRIPGFTQV